MDRRLHINYDLLTYTRVCFVQIQALGLEKEPGSHGTNEEPVVDDYIYDTAADEFMMAFSATNYDTGEPVSDPRYVRWYAATTDVKDVQSTRNTWPMHKCSG